MEEGTTKNFNMFVERNRRGWSQAELGEKVNCSGNYISKIENNLIPVSYVMATKIAAALDTDLAKLFPDVAKRHGIKEK